MKKIFVLVLAILLVSFSGFSKNKRVVSKETQKKIEKTEKNRYFKGIGFLNHKNQFETKLRSSMSSNFSEVPPCYDFGYETICTLPGTCYEYQICNVDFAIVWALHLSIDMGLFHDDCGNPPCCYT